MDFFINHLFGIIDAVFILIMSIVGYIAVRNIKRDAIIAVQEKTIVAYTQQNEVLQGQIDTLKENILDLKKENVYQQHIVETIQEALKKRGMIVTIDGDLVTITDAKGSSSTMRRLSSRPQEGKGS